MTDNFIASGDTFREVLAQEIRAAGGQNALARRIGVSRQYMSHVALSNKPPSDKVLKALGLERRVIYVRVSPND